MKQPFYWDKTIDDANIWCNKVIISDCDNNHNYASLCDLIADCPSVKQLTKSCVINALNDLAKLWENSWLSSSRWFLKVNQWWCLVVADPFQWAEDSDRNVAVSEDDPTPGPLDTKVKWACSYDWLYCIDIEEAWPSLLVWRPSGPTGPFISAPLPSWTCRNWFDVKLKQSWNERVVDYECSETELAPQYCKCIFTWGQSNTPCIKWETLAEERIQRTVRYFLPHKARYWESDIQDDLSDKDNANSYIRWDWAIKWTTEAFWAPDSYWIINIKKTWIYAISFSTYVRWWQRRHSIRCWIYAKDDNGNVRELNDIKYQCWEYPGLDWSSTTKPALNRMFPDEFDSSTWNHYPNTWWTLDNTWLPFSRTYIVNVKNTPTEIFMAVKPDMRDEDPRIIKWNDRESNYHIYVTWSNDNEYSAATTVEITRLNDYVTDNRMSTIKIN